MGGIIFKSAARFWPSSSIRWYAVCHSVTLDSYEASASSSPASETGLMLARRLFMSTSPFPAWRGR